jgi:hypothetical protein
MSPQSRPIPRRPHRRLPCVTECYFRGHMAERDLLIHDTVAPHIAAYAPGASAAQQSDFLTHLQATLNLEGRHLLRGVLTEAFAPAS